MRSARWYPRESTKCRLQHFASTGALAVFWLFASASAQAHQFCATNSTELQDALNQSSDGGMFSGQDNDVRLIHHTYKTGAATANAAFVYHSSSATGSLYLEGGYDNTCANQTFEPTLSIVDGNSATRVLAIHSALGVVNVFNMTIQNGESTADVAGLNINPTSGDNSAVGVTNTIIRNNHSAGAIGGVRVYSGVTHGLFISASLIVGNSADQGNGAGEFYSDACASSIINVTVTQNTTSLAGASGGLNVHSSSAANCNVYIYNSIFWNNTTYGLNLEGSHNFLEYDDYGTLGGTPPVADVGSVSTNPLFVDSANSDFHLSGNSPLLALSPDAAIFFDINHNAFPVHGKVDLGAYAETIFTDGFDGS